MLYAFFWVITQKKAYNKFHVHSQFVYPTVSTSEA